MKVPLLLAAAALAAGLGMAAPAAASPATDAFSAACNANPGFFSFAATGLESNPDGLGRFCSCLVDAFSAYPEADLAILTKDVAGEATPQDRTAYGDYTSLEIRAREAADTCAAEVRLTAAAPANMAVFDAACTNSAILLEVIGGTPEQATPLRAKLCSCLVTVLGPQVSAGDAEILASDLDGSATDESRTAFEGYEALAETAAVAFDGCFATLNPTQ